MVEDDAALRDLIGQRLAALGPERWDAIEAARDALAGPGPFGSWGGGEVTASGAIQAPYAIEGAEIRAAQAAMHEAGLVVPFDWPTWLKAREPGPARSPEEGVMMWVSESRMARFAEGSLLRSAEDGHLADILSAVLRARPRSE